MADRCRATPITSHALCSALNSGTMTTSLQELPVDILGNILALASSCSSEGQKKGGCRGAHVSFELTAELTLTCKRFREAMHSTGFWQQAWVQLPCATFHHPWHAAVVTKLRLFGLCPSGPGAQQALPPAQLYQPCLPQLQQLQV